MRRLPRPGSTSLRFSALAATAVAAVAVSLPAHVLAQGAPVTGSADAGKAKNSMCVGCHGLADYHTAYPVVYHVPKIAGQSPQYIINALREYKAGDRNHPSMRGIAGQLTDQDMADLAAYYGRAEGGAK